MTLAIDGLPPLREIVARHGLDARKALGQNFLFDLNLTAKIARGAGPLDGVAVVEVGPGPGGLTRSLLSEGAKKVIAIERDERVLPALAEIGARWPGRLEVVAADALTIKPETLIAMAEGAPIRICANLPYNVATPLLTGWLEAEPWPPFYDRLILMFQREVALRIVATPAQRADYGRLGVLAGWRAEAQDPVRRAARRLRSPAQSHLERRRTDPASRAGPVRPARAVRDDARRLRPAPEDAAAVAESLRRVARSRPRRAPCRGWPRSNDAGGRGQRRGFRGSRAGVFAHDRDGAGGFPDLSLIGRENRDSNRERAIFRPESLEMRGQALESPLQFQWVACEFAVLRETGFFFCRTGNLKSLFREEQGNRPCLFAFMQGPAARGRVGETACRARPQDVTRPPG